jgi:hypothetical protein
MTSPRLMHPVQVEIEQLDRSRSLYDEDFREPVQQAVRGPRTILLGQIHWISDESDQPTNVGMEESSLGYVLFRYADLNAQGVDLKTNDRFVRFGHMSVDVYVVRLTPCAHYSATNGAALVKAYFQDRFPSKQTRGGKDVQAVIPYDDTLPVFDETFDDAFG